MQTSAINADAATTGSEAHPDLLAPVPQPFETEGVLSPLAAVTSWSSSLNAEYFPYDVVLEEYRRVGKHAVSTSLLEMLSRVRSRLPEVRGAAPSTQLLDRFLDAALDKWDGRFANPTYLALSLLPLPDVDNLSQDIAAVERRYDRLFVQLIGDAMRFEIASLEGSSGILPHLRPDARTTEKRCRLGLQSIAPAARRLGLRSGADTTDLVMEARHFWENLAAGLSLDERRTLQLTMMPVSLIHDEYQFIRVLQSYEATFALVAVELREAVRTLAVGEIVAATQRIAAAESVLREAAPLFSLVATMQIEAFQTFRVYTEGASAIQSRNHKLAESLCRQPDLARLDSVAYHSVPEVRERVLSGQVTLDDAFESVRAAGYPNAPDSSGLEETMQRFALTLKRWRRTHYRLAVRMLGERTGTGYTEGTPYLRSVQAIPVFTSLADAEDSGPPNGEEHDRHTTSAVRGDSPHLAPIGRCPFSSLSRPATTLGQDRAWNAPVDVYTHGRRSTHAITAQRPVAITSHQNICRVKSRCGVAIPALNHAAVLGDE
jgi:tryptophan 2,3-dioxygenase